MTNRPLAGLDDAEAAACSRPDPDAGIGALRTTTGNLPLEQLVAAREGRRPEQPGRAHTDLPQPVTTRRWRRHTSSRCRTAPPSPELRMTAGDRVVEAALKERGEARAEYDQAIAAGRRAVDRRGGAARRVHPAGRQHPARRAWSRSQLTTGRRPARRGRRGHVPASRWSWRRATSPAALWAGMERVPARARHPTPTRCRTRRASPRPCCCPASRTRCGSTLEVDDRPGGPAARRASRSSLHAVRGRRPASSGSSRASGPTATSSCACPLGDGARATAALTLVPDDDGTEGTFQLTVLPPRPGPSRASPRRRAGAGPLRAA